MFVTILCWRTVGETKFQVFPLTLASWKKQAIINKDHNSFTCPWGMRCKLLKTRRILEWPSFKLLCFFYSLHEKKEKQTFIFEIFKCSSIYQSSKVHVFFLVHGAISVCWSQLCNTQTQLFISCNNKTCFLTALISTSETLVLMSKVKLYNCNSQVTYQAVRFQRLLMKYQNPTV